MEKKKRKDFKPEKVDALQFLGERSDDKMVFFNPDIPTWEYVTPFLSVFLSMCDGTKTVGELAGLFEFDKVENKTTLQIAFDIVSHFKKRNLIYDPEKSCDAPAGAPSLYKVMIHLTKRCNLFCKYCFANAGNPFSKELSTDELLQLLDDLARMNVKEIWLLGGEPFLREDIFAIAEKGKSRSMEMNVITNGTLITGETAVKMKDYFSTVQVSLDGLEEKHDFVRGKGSFLKTLQGLDLLLEQNVPVVISTTLSKNNINELDRFLSFLVKKGVPALHTVRLQCDGRGAGQEGNTILLEEYFQALFRMYEKWSRKIDFTQIPAFFMAAKHQAKGDCGAGKTSLEINAKGQVFACYKVFNENNYMLGDIRTKNIRDIYKKSLKVYKNHWNGVDSDPVCASCPVRYLCGGGCLVERNKRKNYKDCEARKKFYIWALKHTEKGKIVGKNYHSI